MIDYLTYTEEETAETVRVLEIEMGTPAQFQVSQLVKVIRAWHEGPDNGWWDAFCLEADSHHEVSNGPRETLQKFAERLAVLGWAVESLERFQLICPICINREPELTEEEERMDALVYAAHKGD